MTTTTLGWTDEDHVMNAIYERANQIGSRYNICVLQVMQGSDACLMAVFNSGHGVYAALHDMRNCKRTIAPLFDGMCRTGKVPGLTEHEYMRIRGEMDMRPLVAVHAEHIA